MLKAAIIGASGYTGLELIKLLLNHPEFEISYIATSGGEADVAMLHPILEKVFHCPVAKADAKEAADAADVVFLALPHKAAMGFAKEVIEYGGRVVDLSADYRLDLETYEAFYCPHEDKTHLPQAVYGLPEYYREAVADTRLVANPGCYPTASLLGVLPFIPFMQENAHIFVDAKSGVSGAGKKLSPATHFATVNENLFAYNPLKHRHAPEIREKIRKVSGKRVDLHFVPHLLPLTRGMLCSIYLPLERAVDPMEVLQQAYGDEPFIRLREKPVDIKSTAGTHFCDLFATTEDDALFISSSIDNLLRGASSQALANANLMMGLPEAMGLPIIAYVP